MITLQSISHRWAPCFSSICSDPLGYRLNSLGMTYGWSHMLPATWLKFSWLWRHSRNYTWHGREWLRLSMNTMHNWRWTENYWHTGRMSGSKFSSKHSYHGCVFKSSLYLVLHCQMYCSMHQSWPSQQRLLSTTHTLSARAHERKQTKWAHIMDTLPPGWSGASSAG